MIQRDLHTENATAEERGRNKSALKEVKQLLGIRDVWIISLLFFFYLGVGTTSGGMLTLSPSSILVIMSTNNAQVGWVVEYLVRVRHGNLANIGYVPAGSYGGLFLGRLLLAEPTHRFGERLTLKSNARTLSLYGTTRCHVIIVKKVPAEAEVPSFS
jgi:hypothetical protein